jgi:prepilin-type N-terminal cleavage/methylation domain-containing protein
MSRRRQGFSLIELLVVISAGGLLLSIAIGTVSRAMRIHEETTRQLSHAQRLVQLTDQFRCDVHLSTSLSLDQPTQVIFQLDEGTIAYSVEGNQVKRIQLDSNDRKQVEQYQLSDRAEVAFSSLDEPKRTVMTIQTRTGLQHSPVRVECVVAAVNGKRVAVMDATPDEESTP